MLAKLVVLLHTYNYAHTPAKGCKLRRVVLVSRDTDMRPCFSTEYMSTVVGSQATQLATNHTNAISTGLGALPRMRVNKHAILALNLGTIPS